MNICNSFDIESHGCVYIREGFKYSCDTNEHGECLNPSGEDCRHYCDDAGIVFYEEDEFIEAFFSNNPRGYTVEELKDLYNRISLGISHEWVRGLIGSSGESFTVSKKPLDELPLYITSIKEPVFKLFLQWRLDIGK